MPRARAGASRCGHLGGENALYGDTGRHHAQHRTLRAAPLQHPPRKERAPSGRGVEPGGRQRAGIARPRRGRGLRAQLLRACSTYAPAEPLLVSCAVGAVARTVQDSSPQARSAPGGSFARRSACGSCRSAQISLVARRATLRGNCGLAPCVWTLTSPAARRMGRRRCAGSSERTGFAKWLRRVGAWDCFGLSAWRGRRSPAAASGRVAAVVDGISP